MRTSTLSTVMLAGLIGRAPMSSAGPVCHRAASQWTVVFKASCTEWYANGGLERGEPVPDVCSQEFSGDVKVKEFPWNGEVMIVDNENPKSDFTRQQPEQDVAHYRAGIVLVQSSWDVGSDGFWSPRQGTNTESINASVVYVTTEAEEQKFVKFHSLVEYNPSSPAGKNGDRRLEGHTYEGVYDFDGGIDDPEGTSVPLWMGDEQLSTGQEDEEGSEGIYHPDYIYSYDYVSYDFSYSVELSYLDSYMFDVAEDEALTDDSVRSITAVDIYVCVDEENSLAEMRFYCDPDNTGTATCYEKAAGANTRALNIHGFEMFCAKQCLTGELEGLWCDIFGLDGCRMCSTDCSALCDGAGSCLPCVSCPPDNYHPVSGSTPAPAPTDGGSPYPGQPTPAPGNAEPSAQTPSPTPGPTGFEPVLTLAPATDFSGVHSTYTPAPATTAGSMPSPGSMLRGGSETAAPTWAEGRSSTAAPTWAEGRSSTAAPTWEQDMPTAAPTSVGVDVLHFVCTPGDADSCYNELLAIERDVLEDSGRGLTCEESCIVNGGPWCKAYGLGGCRFCHLNCVDFCVDEGLPEGCLCFEC